MSLLQGLHILVKEKDVHRQSNPMDRTDAGGRGECGCSQDGLYIPAGGKGFGDGAGAQPTPEAQPLPGFLRICELTVVIL